MAANHSTVWQTASSTHWQYPPKRCPPLTIVWRRLSEIVTLPEIILSLVSIREYPARKKARPKPCLSFNLLLCDSVPLW